MMEAILNAITLALIGKFFALSVVILFLRELYALNKNPNNTFSFSDIFVDETGKAGGSKMRINLAFLAATGVLFFFAFGDKLSEWYFSAYLLAFVGDRISSRLSVSKDGSKRHRICH